MRPEPSAVEFAHESTPFARQLRTVGWRTEAGADEVTAAVTDIARWLSRRN